MFSLKYPGYVGLPVFLSVALASGASNAVPLHPEGIETYTSEAARSLGNPYRDDVYLGGIVFGGTQYTFLENMVAIAEFEVLSGRANINAEWGDWDDAQDGDASPFAKAGFDPSLQETLNPLIQDLTLKQVFNSNSLTEMSDGEGGGIFSFKAAFSQSLVDNMFGLDAQPELVLFERGRNDRFDMRLITGGSFEDPNVSDWLAVDSRQFAPSGIHVDTVEIASPQEIGVGGFDIDQFGVPGGTRVYGLEIRSRDGTGPDLNGMFLTAETAASLGPPLLPVPVETSALLSSMSALGMLMGWAWLARRRNRPARDNGAFVSPGHSVL